MIRQQEMLALKEYLQINDESEPKIVRSFIEDFISLFEEIQRYRAIGTAEECRVAMEKQRAKKRIDGKTRKCIGYYQCPVCGGLLTTNKRFCEDCGQSIDWIE